MPSSTSSSESHEDLAPGRRFLWVTLGWCAVFLGLYAAWFAWAQPRVHTYQSFSAANAGLAEQWQHGARPRAVLVGSSLSHLVPQEVLGSDVQNMAFSRESALTGLSILTRAEVKPEVVVIEVNKIMRGIDVEFVDRVADPTRVTLRTHIPILRTDAQPINILLSSLRSRYGRTVEQKMADTVDPATLERMLAMRLDECSTAPAPGELDARIGTLAALVETLEAAGTVPVFLLTPIEPELDQTVHAKAVRAGVKAAFPSPRYRWVDTRRDAPYRTVDSEHLLYRDAWFLGERIVETVESVAAKSN